MADATFRTPPSPGLSSILLSNKSVELCQSNLGGADVLSAFSYVYSVTVLGIP